MPSSIAFSWALCALVLLLAVGNEARAAARSTKVVIKNDSGQVLIFEKGEARHGIIKQHPPQRIKSGGFGVLFAESKGIATGTEGWVRYKIEGNRGEVQFNWDNPFVGNNSASASAPRGFKGEQIGDKGNRTLVFFSVHPAGRPDAVCNADWVIDSLGKKAEDKLDEFDRAIGFLTTPGKKLGVGGWVATGCRAVAIGRPVRNAQHSTDGFWTIDVRVESFVIGNRQLKPGLSGRRFVRIEVEPNTPAHKTAKALKAQHLQIEGVVLIDTHHGDELIEIHPHEPMKVVK